MFNYQTNLTNRAPWSLNRYVFNNRLNSPRLSYCRSLEGRLNEFDRRGPAVAKHWSSKMLCDCRTAHIVRVCQAIVHGRAETAMMSWVLWQIRRFIARKDQDSDLELHLFSNFTHLCHVVTNNTIYCPLMDGFSYTVQWGRLGGMAPETPFRCLSTCL